MGDIRIKASQWKQVEVGRVVLFTNGPFSGKLAVVVEIIDHKRVKCPDPSICSYDLALFFLLFSSLWEKET
jgi:large subunit ribosomal protein L14e